MSIWSSLAGRYRMQLTSADPVAALAALQNAGIVLLDPECTDILTWQFSVSRKDGKRIQQIADSRGERWEVLGRFGLYWPLISIWKRPFLVFGLLMLLALSILLPKYILFFEVEGNVSLSAREILDAAEGCGIYFGAPGKEVRSQRIKDHLLQQLPQLQWAGVEVRGCVAVITVKERTMADRQPEINGVCSIVATQDAIITQMVVLRGNPLCSSGQAVKAGQVLISGYTDCGICLQALRAEGEILGLTKRSLTTICPLEIQNRTKIRATTKKYSLIIGKKQINFYKDSGILGMTCAKIYEQKYMTLPGGFQLPLSLVCETWIDYETETSETEPAQDLLSGFSRQYVLAQTLAGKVEYSQEYITVTNGCIRLDAVYGCLENIGMVRMEESLPEYGKSD